MKRVGVEGEYYKFNTYIFFTNFLSIIIFRFFSLADGTCGGGKKVCVAVICG